MFNLRLAIIKNILQCYHIFIVYQLLIFSYSNAETVKNSNHTGFCNGGRLQSELQKVLLDSQRRNKISMDYLTGAIFTETKRISDVLFTSNENHNYDDFIISLTKFMEKLESEVVSCYIGINDETKEFLKFLKNPDFTSDNETKGICYNQQLQTSLKDSVKNLSNVVVHSFIPFIQTLNQMTAEIRKGPKNSSDTPDHSYDYIRNYLLDITLDLRTETGIAFYKSMRVVFVITRIIGYELHDTELVDKKLIEKLMAAYNDVLDGGIDSENSTLPYCTGLFADSYVLKGANVNQANLNLNKPLIRNQIADIVFSLIGALIGDLITEGIKYMAGVPPFGGPHAVSIGSTTVNENDVNLDKVQNCTIYYNELRKDLFEGLQESSVLLQQTVPIAIQLYENITKYLAMMNSRPHFLPPALRISEWFEVGEKLYNELLNFVTICTPLAMNYVEKMEAIYNQSVVTSRKLLSANCLNHLLTTNPIEMAISEDRKTSKRVRLARDIVPIVSKLMDFLPLNMDQLGPNPDVNQLSASNVTTNSTNKPLPPSGGNTDLDDWLNLLRSISKMLFRKLLFLMNVSN
ncbi:uncharacterized protein isoform X1 [Rhodnius prolixus]|uniref:uncharacterized protein isoform X1 n=1 Tax=Rhodnius prolixus TaxID=13249 RepID=UPI003D188B46